MKLLIIILLIPLSIEAKVFSKNEWVKLYLRNCGPGVYACRQELEKNFGRMQAYQKLVFKHLDKYGLPRWLATVPIVESSYNNKATSPAGALGLWQIMGFNIKAWKTRKITVLGRTLTIVPTDNQIKRYGHNPVVSTKLAAKHLSDLYKKYRDYENTEELALMAYNAGGFRIDCQDPKTKKLTEKCKRMGILRKPLSDETRNYYTKLMAIQYIMKHSSKLGIKPVKQRRILFHYHILALTRLEENIDAERIRLVFKRVLG